MRRLALFVAAVIAFPISSAWADPPSATEIDALVRQLGDKRFQVREQASKKLWQMGLAAEPALKRAAKDSDVEVAQRAKALLEKIDWGILPDTPAAVATQLEAYRDGDAESRRRAMAALIDLGPPGFQALGRLRPRVTDEIERKALNDALAAASVKAVPPLIRAHDYDSAEALLESCIDANADWAIGNYTALIVLRNKLPAAIARWEKEEQEHPSPRTAELLAHLYRAAGDWPKARKHAAGRDELLDDILWEQGDWAALVERPIHDRPQSAQHAIRAAYKRLAGDQKGSNQELDALAKISIDEDENVVRGLLLNERPAAVFDLVPKNPSLREMAFDLMIAQMRYRDAFKLADQPAPAGQSGDDRRFAVQRGRALFLIGEKDQASQLFARVASALREATDAEIAEHLVETQVRLGLTDAARESAAQYLGALGRTTENRLYLMQRVLEALFAHRGADASVWWRFLRQKFPKDDESATMRRLSRVLEPAGKPADDLGALIDGLLSALNAEDRASTIRHRLAAAAAFEAAGQLDAAIAQLRKLTEEPSSDTLWIRLGDLLAKNQQFREAADAYSRAAGVEPTGALPLYLQAIALRHAGQVAAADAVLDQARIVSLGDVLQRATVADELVKRNEPELARRERELVQQLGWRKAWSSGGLLVQMAIDAAARKDFARAADCYERIALSVLESQAQFVATAGYITVPALAHAYRARAALAAGNLDAARAQADACLTLTPGNADLAILLVPELAKRGRAADADALYRRAAAPHLELCKDHPTSAHVHNEFAWLAACCHRDLDLALQYAQKATELAPKKAGFRDTLAEVYFQRGDKARAIALMKECLKMEPKRVYFAKQLQRFEAGDPSIPPPADTEGDSN